MSNYKVLVVDDERMIREGIADMIDWRSLGLMLAGTAPDGLSAYREIIEKRPDIVITDIKMPKLNGLELIQKTQSEISGTTFIVLSGYGEFELAAQAMKFGVKHYLLKPSNEEEIIQVLHEVKAELEAQRSKERQWEGMQRQLAETGSSGQSARSNAFYATTEGWGASDSELVPGAAANAAVWSAEEDEYVRTIAAAIRNGEESELERGLAVFFHALFEKRPEAKFATGRCMELLDAAFKEAALAFGYKKESDGVRIWQMKTLKEIQRYMTEELSAIMDSQRELRSDKRSRVIARIKQLTDEHLDNRQLSLQWLAQHHLFLNSEYLGKLFRQETGEKYTRYLTVMRMEKAKELIESLPQLKMYEIAERCGFEQDPQYFANVFKKIYDCSPAEYRKRISGVSE
ncbi:response regulator transcription factor [Paenibacillus radicis (ex Gao et al. 2016)]|uniref:Transcriptional regulatory protein YesN n=1 Tax=Paenibacillus radicis (ex Gao et al. 2016) TaxID=1737354 RepID=A0A917H1C0_9BACL|nr:response regulator [Paenibacillus radicis (ex Gao et al. 2016)]GGG64274.1 putative transcriptional regulatory protein YesN [Paenibacillus radicis (ex Gao et al. 2016)]